MLPLEVEAPAISLSPDLNEAFVITGLREFGLPGLQVGARIRAKLTRRTAKEGTAAEYELTR